MCSRKDSETHKIVCSTLRKEIIKCNTCWVIFLLVTVHCCADIIFLFSFTTFLVSVFISSLSITNKALFYYNSWKYTNDSLSRRSQYSVTVAATCRGRRGARCRPRATRCRTRRRRAAPPRASATGSSPRGLGDVCWSTLITLLLKDILQVSWKLTGVAYCDILFSLNHLRFYKKVFLGKRVVLCSLILINYYKRGFRMSEDSYLSPWLGTRLCYFSSKIIHLSC